MKNPAVQQMSLLSDEKIGGDAVIQGHYRYRLRRWWGTDKKMLVWLLLNPSTADAVNDDATLRRVIFYSKREGYSQLTVVNLFALRSKDPKELLSADDPVGPGNNQHIMSACSLADMIVLGWGDLPFGSKHRFASRERDVLELLAGPLYCFGMTQKGSPRHPLYLHSGRGLELYSPP